MKINRLVVSETHEGLDNDFFRKLLQYIIVNKFILNEFNQNSIINFNVPDKNFSITVYEEDNFIYIESIDLQLLMEYHPIILVMFLDVKRWCEE